jgi:hypothetical protein
VGEQAPAFDGDVVVCARRVSVGDDGFSCERMPQRGVGDLSEDEQPSLSRPEAGVVFRASRRRDAPLGASDRLSMTIFVIVVAAVV